MWYCSNFVTSSRSEQLGLTLILPLRIRQSCREYNSAASTCFSAAHTLFSRISILSCWFLRSSLRSSFEHWSDIVVSLRKMCLVQWSNYPKCSKKTRTQLIITQKKRNLRCISLNVSQFQGGTNVARQIHSLSLLFSRKLPCVPKYGVKITLSSIAQTYLEYFDKNIGYMQPPLSIIINRKHQPPHPRKARFTRASNLYLVF